MERGRQCNIHKGSGLLMTTLEIRQMKRASIIGKN
jgi:hypothetical protein